MSDEKFGMALRGIKVVEMAGLAPAPFCGMILSDFGAEVIRVDKANAPPLDRLGRGKKSIALDLKKPQGISIVRKLCSTADVLIEPFRPGVMEKLGLGPEPLMKANRRLIYARMTGFGQDGPYSSMAGHDINYVAISGILSMLGGRKEPPMAPQNLLADFAGGGLICALGIVLALFERHQSQRGQVIDASMVEGAAYVGSWLYKSRDLPVWSGIRGHNWFDGGSHIYGTYETSDGRFITVGALEPQFYAELTDRLHKAGISDVPPQFTGDVESAKARMAEIFGSKSRREWQDIFDGSDACVAPVLTMDEAPEHPHNSARNAYLRNAAGQYEPVPAPRLDRTPARPQVDRPEPRIGQDSIQVLRTYGYQQHEIDQFLQQKIVFQSAEPSKL